MAEIRENNIMMTTPPVSSNTLQHQADDESSFLMSMPHFSNDGTVLTESERLAQAERKGVCGRCGIQTHKTQFPLRKVPLTNDDVYQGCCIRCSSRQQNGEAPPAVPLAVYEAWEERNPNLAINRRRQRAGGAFSSSLKKSTGSDNTTTTGESSTPPRGSVKFRSSLTGSIQNEEQNSPYRRCQSQGTAPTTTATKNDAPLRKAATTGHTVASSSPHHRRDTSHSSTAQHHRRDHSQGQNSVINTTAIPPLTGHSRGNSGGVGAPARRSSAIANDIFATALQSEQSLSLSEKNAKNDDDRIHPLLRVENEDEIEIEYSEHTTIRSSTRSTTTSNTLSLSIHSMSSVSEMEDFFDAASEEKISPPRFLSQTLLYDDDSDSVDEGAPVTASVELNTEDINQWLQEEHPDVYDQAVALVMTNQLEILRAVLTALKVSRLTPSVQQNGCWILQNWPNKQSVKPKHVAKVVETLVSSLKCNLGDAVMAEYACKAVYQWIPQQQLQQQQQHAEQRQKTSSSSDHGSIQSEAITGAVDALISCLERHTDSLSVQRPATMALHESLLLEEALSSEELTTTKVAKLVGTIHSVMQTYSDDAILQHACCGILLELLSTEQMKSCDDETKQQVVNEQLLASICLAIDRNQNLITLLREAFGGLYYATCHFKGTSGTSTFHASVLEAMKLHLTDATIQSYGCGILKNASVKKANVQNIVEANGIDGIVQAMENHPDVKPLACHGCRALKHLATNDQNELLTQQKGGISVIVRAIQDNPLDAAVQSEGFGALANLCLRQDTRTILLRQLASLETSILLAMKKHKMDTSVQQKVCMVVLNLSSSESFAASFDKSKGIDLLVAAMTNHPEDAKLQQSAVGSLKNFTRKGMCSASIAASGAIRVVIKSMKAFAGNIKMQILAIGFLKNASTHKENALLIPQSKGVHAILCSMEKHQCAPALQQEACLALMNLSRVKDIGVVVAVNGGISSAITAMQQHGDSPQVQNAACGLLWNLSITKSSHALIADGKGVDAILKAMMNHPRAVDVQQKACLALYNLMEHKPCRVAIDHGCGMDAALAAMREHPSDLSLQKYACRFVAAMVRSKKHVDVLAENGGLPVVKAALEKHGTQNSDLKKYANRILETCQDRLR